MFRPGWRIPIADGPAGFVGAFPPRPFKLSGMFVAPAASFADFPPLRIFFRWRGVVGRSRGSSRDIRVLRGRPAQAWGPCRASRGLEAEPPPLLPCKRCKGCYRDVISGRPTASTAAATPSAARHRLRWAYLSARLSLSLSLSTEPSSRPSLGCCLGEQLLRRVTALSFASFRPCEATAFAWSRRRMTISSPRGFFRGEGSCGFSSLGTCLLPLIRPRQCRTWLGE